MERQLEGVQDIVAHFTSDSKKRASLRRRLILVIVLIVMEKMSWEKVNSTNLTRD